VSELRAELVSSQVALQAAQTGLLASEEKLKSSVHASDTLGISEVRYRRLFEAAHDGILLLSTETRRITDVNPFMLELLD